jgi:Peptidase family M1 domain
MHKVVIAALLLTTASSGIMPEASAAQDSAGPRPVQPARPLALPTLQPPIADTGIFSAAPLPAPTENRRADGSPGRAYWQQRVNYAIRATLDTTEKRIKGAVAIGYTNNSPDTLRYVWLQLDQNLFRPGSTGSLLFASDSRFGGAGFKGGFEIQSATQCVQPAGQRSVSRGSERGGGGAVPRGRRSRRVPAPVPSTPLPPCPSVSLKTRVDDTMMYMDLVRAIPPGGSTQFDLKYAFNVPEHGADRMGRDGSLYQIAQWYPRMAVYDDVNGWNTDQYLGQGEFYLEYGTIDYEVTLPPGYIVAGTGVLVNPADVLTEAQRQRLAAAATSDTVIHILTEPELRSGGARPDGSDSLTWRFHAENVRDVAWAASPEYLWDGSRWEGVLIQAYYRPSALETWKDAVRMSRYSIGEYSTRWFRYPYPQMSAIEGPVSGMEYPMVAMEARGESSEALFRVVTHEIGHSWYPMIVGSDERRYAWMDEGFNTFINTFAEEGFWRRNDSSARLREREIVIRTDQVPTAQPIMTPANRYKTSPNLLSLAYVKPSVALLTLRNKVLDPTVFDSGFREYTRRWAFKHPQPADFFRTIEEISGRDLSWFWRGFFFTTAALDQAVDGVKQEAGGPTQVTIANLGDAVMPVELLLTFEDGTTGQAKLPVEIWFLGDRYVYEDHSGKKVVKATVNPDGTFPDALTTNDAWPAADTSQARTSSANEGK